MLKVIFFRTTAGNEPVLDWLRAQDDVTRRLIGEDLLTVQFGWPMGMPVVRSLGNGLFEVRTNLPNAIARIVFFQHGQDLIVVEGFIKKSQRTPKEHLENARRRKGEYERNAGSRKRT